MKSIRSLGGLADALGTRPVRQFFVYARDRYFGRHQENATLERILRRVSERLRTQPERVWGSQKFQLSMRASSAEDLTHLGFDGQTVEQASDALASGRVMSLLPFNYVLGQPTVKKFLPSRPDRYSGKWKHSIDPYGIFRRQDRVIAISQGNEMYLGTRKFPYAVLANIIESCHIGCDGCYKGSMVRTAMSALADVDPEYAQIKRQLTAQEQRVRKQAGLLTRWLNNNAEVDTIVISGGEPLLFTNQGLDGVLEEFGKAKHVDVVRICTSSIFQGMWYRIDEAFTRLLRRFEENTGKKLYVNGHVTDEHQLLAAEARIALDRLRYSGISTHLQMPLQQGINFDRDDLAWSTEKIRKISKAAYRVGAIPYKLIVDMHSPSHPDLTVPIETVSRAIGVLDSHSSNSDMERWQAYNVLHEQGNSYLTSSLEAEKIVRDENVVYFIPKRVGRNICVHTYREPRLAGHNDNPESLNNIADHQVREKIAHVMTAYEVFEQEMRAVEQCAVPQDRASRALDATLEFNRMSGIISPMNEPLLLD